MYRKLSGLLLVAGLLLPVAAKADSVNPAWEFTSADNEFASGGNYTFGEVFTATQNTTINMLGYYNPSTGMTDTHLVGLFASDGTLLASTTVTSASTYSTDHFLYNSITAITLVAGDTYVLEGVSGSDLYTWNDTGFTVNMPLTIDGSNWVEDAGLTFNGTDSYSGVDDGFWGADMGYEEGPPPVPEPSSFMLLGSGLAALAGVIGRKLKA
jgi:hypothetical protein